jgi:peptidoglycan/LPS O-acetylase OafA/YrhL
MTSIPKRRFLNSINYFRGIAIIIIVMTHSYGIAHWNVYQDASLFEKVFYSFNLNGSVFFVFISGYLYHHIFYPNFNYQKFLTKKAKFVLIPYLICSALPIIYTVFDRQNEWLLSIVFDSGGIDFLPASLQNKPLLSVLWFIATGRAVYAYWFIPMVILIFMIAPFVNYLIRTQHLLKVILFLIPVSMIVHRPLYNMNPLHSLIYFLPVYLLGIYSSINRQTIITYLKRDRHKLIVLSLAILLCLIQVLIFNVSGNFSKSFFSITVPDINIIQKILLCFLFISVLDNLEEAEINSLKQTAQTSFAIYFIHPFLLRPLTRLSKVWGNFEGNLLTLFIATLLVVIISIAIAHLVKLVFNKNSRYIIGW